MIQIKNSMDCCGCSACGEACNHKAITMTPDKWGFLYPVVNQSLCVDCGLCNKVCPMLNTSFAREPLVSYAFKHKDIAIRRNTSTAGAFVAFSKQILAEGGVVFGAAFDDDFSVRHLYVEEERDLWNLVGSKYLQSRMETSYMDCKRFLREGRKVLFSGTPCQIAGLKSYLRKEYDNLICIDLICHGVPAPGIWQKYLHYQEQKMSHEIGKSLFISKVNFRNKSRGWSSYSLSLSLSLSDKDGHVYEIPPCDWRKDVFMRSFLSHLNMRPSCFHCRFRNQRSGSDITIGDFWKFDQVHPEAENDQIGINAVMVNTQKGVSLMRNIDFDGFESSYEKIKIGNMQLVKSHRPHINRKKFLRQLDTSTDFEALVSDCLHLSPLKKILSKVRTFYYVYLKKN